MDIFLSQFGLPSVVFNRTDDTSLVRSRFSRFCNPTAGHSAFRACLRPLGGAVRDANQSVDEHAKSTNQVVLKLSVDTVLKLPTTRNCSFAPELRKDAGGRRHMPVVVDILDFIKVKHVIYPNDPMERTGLWMHVVSDDIQVKSSLWYKPGRTLIASDAIDLAYGLQPFFRLSSLWTASGKSPNCNPKLFQETACGSQAKAHLIKVATEQLRHVDSILFTSHLDSSWCFQKSTTPKCCGSRLSRLSIELIAIRHWAPLAGCPAHPSLRRGASPQPCTCERQQSLDFGGGGTRCGSTRNCTKACTDPLHGLGCLQDTESVRSIAERSYLC